MWTGESFTLTVGEDARRLIVPRGILGRIAYFKAALSTGNFVEARTSTFQLADYNAQAVADAVQYACSGHVGCLRYQFRKPNEELSKQPGIIKRYVNAYVLADRWSMEEWANALVDELCQYHEKELPDSESIAMSRSVGLEDSLLYDFLVQKYTYDMLGQNLSTGQSQELLSKTLQS